MTSEPEQVNIEVGREGVNDDTVLIVEWLVGEGDPIQPGEPVVTLETTKSVFDLLAPAAGFVFPLAAAGREVPVGTVVGIVSASPRRPNPEPVDQSAPAAGDQVITAKARRLIEDRQLDPAVFAHLAVVRAADVEECLAPRGPGPAVRLFRGEPLDPDTDWDAVLGDELHRRLDELLTRLRQRMKARFDRHVPTGELLHDRWDLAREYGFGEGTSVYDSAVIGGAVSVGRHCWVGPNTALDGSGGGLTIGDHVDIGAGTHVYTHNTIERALTGGRAAIFHKPTRIGSCCFIAPYCVIAPGTVLGDHCFVAAGSYVEGVFPSYSYLAGNPATRVGSVTVENNRASVRLDAHRPT